MQVLLNMMQFGMDPQAALDAPRFCIPSGSSSGEVLLEEGISGESMAALQSFGHAVALVRGHDRAIFGRGQIIQRTPNGAFCSGSDPRADGCASGR
jgi:gamma-glutamyltranspeptidase/glutathione hydrolase